jgi:hypothetical protein
MRAGGQFDDKAKGEVARRRKGKASAAEWGGEGQEYGCQGWKESLTRVRSNTWPLGALGLAQFRARESKREKVRSCAAPFNVTGSIAQHHLPLSRINPLNPPPHFHFICLCSPPPSSRLFESLSRATEKRSG